MSIGHVTYCIGLCPMVMLHTALSHDYWLRYILHCLDNAVVRVAVELLNFLESDLAGQSLHKHLLPRQNTAHDSPTCQFLSRIMLCITCRSTVIRNEDCLIVMSSPCKIDDYAKD